jgi:CBS domain containing-hemolysin-like protein
MGTLGEIVIIAILILLNAVLVAAEIALVTVRRTRVDQLVDEGNRSARRVRRLIAQPGRFLAVIQLGITFIGFLASAYAAVSLTIGLVDFFSQFPVLAICRGLASSSAGDLHHRLPELCPSRWPSPTPSAMR